MNEEEKKMGIKGSSTRQIFFNDCKVPKENMLSERQNGFKIAVNILNIGRIKLAAAAFGASKSVISNAVRYANERKQFGTAIANFGAIKHKLGEMAPDLRLRVGCLPGGSEHRRCLCKACCRRHGRCPGKLKSVEEFAIECAILKVHGSETLDYVVDEGVQIYGGMGFSADAPMDRAYRDARINRIFEGTNEINRMLTIDMLLKRAMKGEIDLMNAAMAVQKDLTSIPDFGAQEDSTFFAAEKKVLANLKKAGLMIAGAAAQKLMQKLSHEQEILMNLADMLIQVYAFESAILRTEKLAGMRGEEAVQAQIDMTRIYMMRAVEIAGQAGREAIYAFAEGDELRLMLMGLKRYTKVEPFNLKEARRRVANILIEKNEYVF